MDKFYIFLLQEGHLFRSSLTSGLNALVKASPTNKDNFYTASFQLSIGLERLLKTVLIINHMVENNSTPPTQKNLKKYGHDLINLYAEVAKICRNFANAKYYNIENDSMSYQILNLLSEFSRVSRYYNLDSMNKNQKIIDPLEKWQDIFLQIFKRSVSKKKQKFIYQSSQELGSLLSNCSHVVACSLDKKQMSHSDIVSSSLIYEASSKYVIYDICLLIEPFRRVFSDIYIKAMKQNIQSIPVMYEFLDWLPSERKHIIQKKRWP